MNQAQQIAIKHRLYEKKYKKLWKHLYIEYEDAEREKLINQVLKKYWNTLSKIVI